MRQGKGNWAEEREIGMKILALSRPGLYFLFLTMTYVPHMASSMPP
jgi:hypothetical protein